MFFLFRFVSVFRLYFRWTFETKFVIAMEKKGKHKISNLYYWDLLSGQNMTKMSKCSFCPHGNIRACVLNVWCIYDTCRKLNYTVTHRLHYGSQNASYYLYACCVNRYSSVLVSFTDAKKRTTTTQKKRITQSHFHWYMIIEWHQCIGYFVLRQNHVWCTKNKLNQPIIWVTIAVGLPASNSLSMNITG